MKINVIILASDQLLHLIIPVAFCWDLMGRFSVAAEADRPVALRSGEGTIDKADINQICNQDQLTRNSFIVG